MLQAQHVRYIFRNSEEKTIIYGVNYVEIFSILEHRWKKTVLRGHPATSPTVPEVLASCLVGTSCRFIISRNMAFYPTCFLWTCWSIKMKSIASRVPGVSCKWFGTCTRWPVAGSVDMNIWNTLGIIANNEKSKMSNRRMYWEVFDVFEQNSKCIMTLHDFATAVAIEKKLLLDSCGRHLRWTSIYRKHRGDATVTPFKKDDEPSIRWSNSSWHVLIWRVGWVGSQSITSFVTVVGSLGSDMFWR